eukprot:COSAG06_NODE_148_length_22056_cov_75.881239_20_plen_129_part_00
MYVRVHPGYYWSRARPLEWPCRGVPSPASLSHTPVPLMASSSSAERKQIAERTAHYSGADLRALCGDAAMGPIRELPPDQIATIDAASVRPVSHKDLREACDRTRPSVGASQVAELEAWNREFGSFQM